MEPQKTRPREELEHALAHAAGMVSEGLDLIERTETILEGIPPGPTRDAVLRAARRVLEQERRKLLRLCERYCLLPPESDG